MSQPQYPNQPPPYWPTQQQSWPGQGQQPQQQQQAQGYPPQQGFYPQQQQAQGYPPQQQQMPMPGGPPPPPPQYEVDEQAVTQAYQEAAQYASGGSGIEWFKFIPPEGYQRWDLAPPGSSRTHNVWFCQPAPGSRTIVHHYRKHRYQYYEAGQRKFSGIDCGGGNATCLFCQGIELARQYPNLASSVENWGKKPSNLYLYNIVDLDFPQLHVGEGGQMFPLILDCGPKLNKQIGDLTAPEGLGLVTALVDPQNGRPTRLTRKKTGTENWDVEYSAQYAPNPSPLPQQFWPVLQNLYDLTKVRRQPSPQDYITALTRLGWPIPQGQIHSPSLQGAPQQPAAYTSGPMPPHNTPYQSPQPMLPQQPGAYGPGPMPPPGMPGPSGPTPPPGMQGAWSQPPPPQHTPQGYMPQPPPSPMAAMGAQQPVAPVAPPPPSGNGAMQGPPPPMNPPPMQTTGQGDASHYAPPPQSMPPQGMPQQGPPQGVTQQGPPQGAPPLGPGTDDVPFNGAPAASAQTLVLDPSTGKLPAGTDLAGRERCFGKYVERDTMCKQCPDWIKRQCVPQSGAAAPMPDPELHALQQQLEGQPQQ